MNFSITSHSNQFTNHKSYLLVCVGSPKNITTNDSTNQSGCTTWSFKFVIRRFHTMPRASNWGEYFLRTLIIGLKAILGINSSQILIHNINSIHRSHETNRPTTMTKAYSFTCAPAFQPNSKRHNVRVHSKCTESQHHATPPHRPIRWPYQRQWIVRTTNKTAVPTISSAAIAKISATSCATWKNKINYSSPCATIWARSCSRCSRKKLNSNRKSTVIWIMATKMWIINRSFNVYERVALVCAKW